MDGSAFVGLEKAFGIFVGFVILLSMSVGGLIVYLVLR